jgi:hypothetical protein
LAGLRRLVLRVAIQATQSVRQKTCPHMNTGLPGQVRLAGLRRLVLRVAIQATQS